MQQFDMWGVLSPERFNLYIIILVVSWLRGYNCKPSYIVVQCTQLSFLSSIILYPAMPYRNSLHF